MTPREKLGMPHPLYDITLRAKKIKAGDAVLIHGLWNTMKNAGGHKEAQRTWQTSVTEETKAELARVLGMQRVHPAIAWRPDAMSFIEHPLGPNTLGRETHICCTADGNAHIVTCSQITEREAPHQLRVREGRETVVRV